MTIFDVVLDGSDHIEVAMEGNASKKDGRNVPLVGVRAPGSKRWHALFRRSWEERALCLMGIKQTPLSKDDMKRLTEGPWLARVSVGFEYPFDADSRDGATWLTLDVLPAGHKKPTCVVNAELA